MRILIRISKWAIWSRRLASLSLPLLIIPVFMHRERMITSDDFIRVETVALCVTLLALFLGLAAFVRIWSTGDRGWGRAMMGVFISLLCLAPLGLAAFAIYHYPPVIDVTTDWANPPALVTPGAAMPTTPEEQAQVEAMFPNARSRSYLLDAQQLFALVETEVAAQHWEVLAREAPNGRDAGRINALATTLLGWRDEVAVVVRGGTDGSSLSMRSTSLSGSHDFGANGQRIEAFMLAIDEAVTALARDTPVATPADDTPPPPEPPVDPDAPVDEGDALEPAPEG